MRPGFLVAGSPRSGRSTTLATLAIAAARRKIPVVAVCPDPEGSAFSEIASTIGATILRDDETRDERALCRAIDVLDDMSLILVDGATRFSKSPADLALAEFLNAKTNLRAVIAGTVDELRDEIRGRIPACRRSQCGILLSPSSPLDGSIFGVRLDKSVLGRTPGRGLLVQETTVLPVQVALPI